MTHLANQGDVPSYFKGGAAMTGAASLSSCALSHPSHPSTCNPPTRTTMVFTPDSALDLLFPEEFVPQHIKDQLPPELHVRLTSRHPPGLLSCSSFLILYSTL